MNNKKSDELENFNKDKNSSEDANLSDNSSSNKSSTSSYKSGDLNDFLKIFSKPTEKNSVESSKEDTDHLSNEKPLDDKANALLSSRKAAEQEIIDVDAKVQEVSFTSENKKPTEEHTESNSTLSSKENLKEELPAKQITKETPVEEPKPKAVSVAEKKETTEKVSFAKIPVVKKAVKKESLKKTPENSDKSEKSSKKKRFFSKKPKTKTEYQEKVDKVILSVKELFAPFKEVLIKSVPIFRYPIMVLDIIGLTIGFLAKFIALRIPFIVKFLKSIYFKLIFIVLVALFIGGAFVSRSLNSQDSVDAISRAVYDQTNYKISINGVIRFTFIPSFAFSIKDVSLSKGDDYTSTELFNIASLSAQQITVKFKTFPLLFGKLEIEDIVLSQGSILLKPNENEIQSLGFNNDYSYTNVENYIRNQLNSVQEVTNPEVTEENDTLAEIEELDLSSQDETQQLLEEIDKIVNSEGLETLTEENSTSTSTEETTEEETLSEAIDLEEKAKEEEILKEEEIIKEELEKAKQQELEVPAAINNTKDKDLIYRALVLMFSNVNLNIKDIPTFKVERSFIAFLNQYDQRVFTLTSFRANLSQYKGYSEIAGSFRFMDNRISYNTTISNNDEPNKTMIYIGRDRSDYLLLNSTNEDGLLSGNIESFGKGANFFINNFLVGLDNRSENINLKSNFTISNQQFAINDINIQQGNHKYSGSFIWNYGLSGSDAVLDLSIEEFDVNSLVSNYLEKQRSSSGQSLYLRFVDVVKSWKISKINNLKISNFRINVDFIEPEVSNIVFNNANISAFINNFDDLFIENISLSSYDSEFKSLGVLNLSNNTGELLLDIKGSLDKSLEVLSINPSTGSALKYLAEDNNEMSLSQKIVLNSSRITLNNVTGNIGNFNFKQAYSVISERSSFTDVLIDLNLQEVSFEELLGVYENQVSLSLEQGKTNDILGFNNKVHLNLRVGAEESSYYNIKLKDLKLDISVENTGFTLNRIEALSLEEGRIVGSFQSDTQVSPMASGYINFINFHFNSKDIQDFAFKNAEVVGNVVLNGTVKSNGSSYQSLINNIGGNLSFIKAERLKLSRFATSSGIYLTLTSRNDKFYINDLYGEIEISNNIMNFYPVFFTYIENQKNYRGSFEGNYNLLTKELSIEGAADQEDDASRGIEVSLKGLLENPSGSINHTRNHNVTQAAPAERERDVLQQNSVTHDVVNNLNNKENEDHFNNLYSDNINNEEEEALKNRNFDDKVGEADTDSAYNFDSNYRNNRTTNHSNERLFDEALNKGTNNEGENNTFSYPGTNKD